MSEPENRVRLRRQKMHKNEQLLVAYKKFLQEKKHQNDENSRLIFIVNYLEKINFALYGMDGKEQLITELEKYYNENEILIWLHRWQIEIAVFSSGKLIPAQVDNHL